MSLVSDYAKAASEKQFLADKIVSQIFEDNTFAQTQKLSIFTGIGSERHYQAMNTMRNTEFDDARPVFVTDQQDGGDEFLSDNYTTKFYGRSIAKVENAPRFIESDPELNALVNSKLLDRAQENGCDVIADLSSLNAYHVLSDASQDYKTDASLEVYLPASSQELFEEQSVHTELSRLQILTSYADVKSKLHAKGPMRLEALDTTKPVQSLQQWADNAHGTAYDGLEARI